MRFKDFLLEHSNDMTYKDFVFHVYHKCQYFLEQSKGAPLYRGSLDSHAGYYKHPEYRKPRDSSKGFNEMFNLGVEEAFGFKDIRKHSVFCSGSANEADNYGDVCFMFPIAINSPLNFIWSKKITDSYAEDHKIENMVRDALIEIDSKIYFGEYDLGLVIADIFRRLKGELNDSNVDDAFNASNDSGKLNTHLIAEKLKEALKNSFSDLYKNTDFKDAINSFHEILIYRSDGYYLIPVAMVKDEMNFAEGYESVRGHINNEMAYEYLLKSIKDVESS